MGKNQKIRLRRMRSSEALRGLVRETGLSPKNLVMPYFVKPGKGLKDPISSMPGQYQFSVDTLVREVKSLGVPNVILFGLPRKKDAKGSEAWAKDGIVQQAVRAIKNETDKTVITDVCLCEYTDHGHCGLIKKGKIDNDSTLPLLQKAAASHVKAGADIVAPSGMMDHVIAALREELPQTPILAYAAKFASAFYGPFREAAQSPPAFGDRSSYQMDPANSNEAMREIELDLAEGADMVMVKPALAYLDIIRRAKEKFNCPMAAYNVSGEYSMVKAAVKEGWLDERKVVLETLLSMRRAGADLILTYHAKDAARWLESA